MVSTPEIFRYWLQGGRIDVGFLGAAQLDRFANINTTVVGSYKNPKVRLPGAGGAPEISSSAKEVLIIVKQTKRTFVEKLDFVTSVGFLTGGNSRASAGLPGNGPAAVITDLCILRPHPVSRELEVTSVHPGVNRESILKSTGWEQSALRTAAVKQRSQTLTNSQTLRDLKRTNRRGARRRRRRRMRSVFICDAVRTPIGRYGGALAQVRADDLAAAPIRELVRRSPGVDWSAVDEVNAGLREPGRRR